MLRRSFLKTIGAAVAAICLPISWVIEKVAAKERLPVGYCPNCYSDDIEVEDGKMFCNTCKATAECRVIISVSKWPATKDNVVTKVKWTKTEDEVKWTKTEDGALGSDGRGLGRLVNNV